MSVSIEPGCTTLTVMSLGPSSRANPCENAVNADFVNAKAERDTALYNCLHLW